MKKVSHPERAEGFSTGAYSDALIANGFIFVSGQASVDFKTSEFKLGTIEEETHRTMKNLKAILEAAGSSLDKIVKCTVHLADIKDFEKYNEVYGSYFKERKPTRTTVQSVLVEGLKVEIDCIALVEEKQSQ